MKESDLKKFASKIIRIEMRKHDMQIKDLVLSLERQGISETYWSLGAKLSRSSFSAGFFLSCLESMGVEQINLKEYRTLFQSTE